MNGGLKQMLIDANENESAGSPADVLTLFNGERLPFSSTMAMPACASDCPLLRLRVNRRCGCNQSSA